MSISITNGFVSKEKSIHKLFSFARNIKEMCYKSIENDLFKDLSDEFLSEFSRHVFERDIVLDKGPFEHMKDFIKSVDVNEYKATLCFHPLEDKTLVLFFSPLQFKEYEESFLLHSDFQPYFYSNSTDERAPGVSEIDWEQRGSDWEKVGYSPIEDSFSYPVFYTDSFNHIVYRSNFNKKIFSQFNTIDSFKSKLAFLGFIHREMKNVPSNDWMRTEYELRKNVRENPSLLAPFLEEISDINTWDDVQRFYFLNKKRLETQNT